MAWRPKNPQPITPEELAKIDEKLTKYPLENLPEGFEDPRKKRGYVSTLMKGPEYWPHPDYDKKAQTAATRLYGRILSQGFYEPQLHDELLWFFARQAKSYVHFCLASNITKNEYYNWAEIYPGFKFAQQKAKMLTQAYWETELETNKNNPYYNVQVATQLQKYTRCTSDHVDMVGTFAGKNSLEKMSNIQKKIEEGDLSLKEASSATKLIALYEDVNYKTEVAKKVEELKKLHEMD